VHEFIGALMLFRELRAMMFLKKTDFRVFCELESVKIFEKNPNGGDILESSKNWCLVLIFSVLGKTLQNLKG
jgi:hypothetical protein